VPPDGVAFGIKEYPEGIALIFRGSVTLQDWLRDAEAIADPSPHEGLGPVHPGFFAGLPELWTRLKLRLTQKPCIVAGHSLGAARASLFTGAEGARRQAAGAATVLWRAPARLPAGRRHHRKCAQPLLLQCQWPGARSGHRCSVHELDRGLRASEAARSDLRAAERCRRAARHSLRLARDAALCIGNAGHSDRLTGRGVRDENGRSAFCARSNRALKDAKHRREYHPP
jgi:Lipase (class 3)